MKLAFLFFFVVIFFPALVNANVIINEIAWMGTANSANDEWLELHNNGSNDMDLAGWVLKAEDDIPFINLGGNITAGGYFLLERTDDNTVPDVAANLIYVGALENSGEILILKNSSGLEVDRVDASGGWPAGDNITKETMQRAGSGWVTAIGTPGVPMAGGESTSGNQSEKNPVSPPSSQTPVTAESQSGSVAPSVNPESQLTADAGPDLTVVAGAPQKFDGRAYGFKGEPLEGADFSWSFGDGGSAKSKIAYHVYSYPGKYRTVFTVVSDRYTTSDYLTITAIEPAVSIAEVKPGADGYIKLRNDSATDLDLSGWIIDNSADHFYIPANTIILAKNHLIIPKEISNIVFPISGTARILFSNAKVADLLEYSGNAGGNENLQSSVTVPVTSSITPYNTLAETTRDAEETKGSLEDVKEEANEETSLASDQTAMLPEFYSRPSSSIFSSGWFWLGIAVTFGLLSAGGVFALRKFF